MRENMNIVSFFTNAGIPATGLSPTVSVWELPKTLVVNAQAMTQVAGGFYSYDFTGYDDTKDYAIRADGGVSLPAAERYVANTNDLGQVTNPLNIVKAVEANKMVIEANQLKIYADDGATVLKTYDLKDNNGNPSSSSVFQRLPV
jgi:hypothetical protein